MNHQDAEITEVVVVLHEACQNKLDDALSQLKAAGVEIFSTDEDEMLVNGSVETFKLKELEKLECVNYIRSVLTYIADYPKGDPRDQDGDEDEDEFDAE